MIDNPVLLMMKPEYFSPIIALIGVLLIMGGEQWLYEKYGFKKLGDFIKQL